MKRIIEEIRTAKSFDGTPIRYVRSGTGKRAIIFIHGWRNDHNVWTYHYEKFLEEGFSVIALDLRGHGLSGKPSRLEDYSFEAYARDVRSVIDKESVEEYVLAGHSLGGMISLYYTYIFDSFEDEKFKGLILIDTTYRNYIGMDVAENLSHFVRNIFDKNNRLIARIYSKDPIAKLTRIIPKAKKQQFMGSPNYTSTHAVASIFKMMTHFDLEDYLKKIRFSVLIVGGNGDRIIPASEGIRMHKLIKGSELHIIQSNYHRTIIKNASEVFDIMENFLAKLDFIPVNVES